MLRHSAGITIKGRKFIMQKFILISLSIIILLANSTALAVKRYSLNYCNLPDFKCIQVKRGQSWSSLFPDPNLRELIQKLNRMNITLYPGMTLAVPQNLSNLSLMSISPFPLTIESPKEKLIVVDPGSLAFAAYTADGNLVLWGPISGGQVFCGDVGSQCRTLAGKYRIFNKNDEKCISKVFPIGKGGAPMPYCMYFHAGAALHGGPNEVPGYHASHGCVRIFMEDAQWLNENFVDSFSEGKIGTRVVINPYY